MTDREAHYQCILSNPDDDTPRLTFADRLDEEGEQDRAAFIRVQVAIAAFAALGDAIDGPLRSRERALFDAHGAAWFGPNAVLELPRDTVLRRAWLRDRPYGLEVARGFPAHWYGPWSKWVGGEKCDHSGDEHRRGRQRGEPYPCAETGRIPGACETLAWRRGWDMECGTCKGQGYVQYSDPNSVPVGGNRCPTCHGSGRVPRPVPSGAVPLTDVTLTTMPEWRFNGDGNAQFVGRTAKHWVARGERVDHSRDGVAKMLCELEWPGLRFHLPSERPATVLARGTGGTVTINGQQVGGIVSWDINPDAIS